jgi:serine/threonine-protein kinase
VANAPDSTSSAPPRSSARRLGRYALYGEIARGGMATVHYGRLIGSVGFSRTVAIKRLHPQFAGDGDFVSMFVDEARLAARIAHPNVIPTLDIVVEGGELALVMDYVQGESLSRLVAMSRHAQSKIPLRVISGLVLNVLAGLHAAHEAKNERGEPLGIVHRDMSPQNVMVGADGVARVFDFGIAKAAGRLQTTREGQFKGKLTYAAPEQLTLGHTDRRTDVYSAGVILWELLTLRKLFKSDNQFHVMKQIIAGEIQKPSEVVEGIPAEVDAIVMKALAKDVADRYASAEEMALALEKAQPHASPREVSEWLAAIAGEVLRSRAKVVEEIEISSQTLISSHDVPTLVKHVGKADEIDADELIEVTGVGAKPHPGAEAIPPTAPAVIISEAAAAPAVAPAPASKGSSLGIVVVALVAVFLVVGGLYVWIQTRPQLSADTFTRKAPPGMLDREVAAKVEDVRAPAPSASAPSPPSSAIVAPSTTATSTSTAPPSATSTVIKPPPTATTTATAIATAPTATATAKPPPSNCNPPFNVDENGIRHPKPECL